MRAQERAGAFGVGVAALYSAEFLSAVAGLRLATGTIRTASTHGERTSARCGPGMEFRDFRPYTPGDDLRRIDWHVYRRSGHLFLRRYEDMQVMPVYLLVDVSSSMFFEERPRADMGRQLAAAIISAALHGHDPVSVFPFDSKLRPAMQRVSGRHRLAQVLEFLEQQRPAGKTDLGRAVTELSAATKRRGLAVVISDFFDERGIGAVTAALEKLPHRLALVRITRQADAEPSLAENLELVDCESETLRVVAPTAAVLDAYRTAYGRFVTGLETFAARHGVKSWVFDTGEPLLPQMAKAFPGGTITV